MNKIKVARGKLASLLKLCRLAGWASLWNIAYILPEQRNNAVLRQHLLVRLEQMKREGKVLFLFKYLGWLLIKGIKNHPYEQEANTSLLLK